MLGPKSGSPHDFFRRPTTNLTEDESDQEDTSFDPLMIDTQKKSGKV
jgi:hypothetical protein